MRISDWSSDVCSSDLENCCGGVLLNPVRSLTRGPDGFPVASPNTLLPLLQFLGANHQVAPAGASFIRRQSTTPGVDYRSDTKRSEEHTSELQSLMRISYAVFCLKKKNIKTI